MHPRRPTASAAPAAATATPARANEATLALGLVAGLLGLGLTACGGGAVGPASTGAPSTAPVVVAGDGVLCDLSTRIAGADLQVRCLLAAGDNPHQFRLTPAQKRDLGAASLVLINGYGLTPALAQLPGAVHVAELAVPDSPLLVGGTPGQADAAQHGGPEERHDPHHDEAHTDGDDHDHGAGDRDPHVWHDPRQASAMAQLVGERLAQRRPAAAPAIRQRSAALIALLGELDQWNRRQLASIPRGPGSTAPPLATGHRAFTSLARRYGLRELPVVDGGSSSSSLRPQAFEGVVRQLQRERVPRLFAEQLPPPRNLERISQLSGVPIASQALVADGLARTATGGDDTSEGSGNLMATLTANTCAISEGLGGRCDRAGERELVNRWRAIR